jgi:hypothetical protein
LAADDPAAKRQAEIQKLIADYDGMRQVLIKHCNKCHGGEKTEGNLNLAALDTGEKAVAATFWTTALERVGLKEMPPEGQKQPSDAERALFFRWTEALVNNDGECNKIATDVNQHFNSGAVMSRRLTRAEYNNTVRDLMGVDDRPADAFPADGSGGEGFDTDGDSLFTNPILMEKYLEAADRIVETALADAPARFTPAVAAARERILSAGDSSADPRDRARAILLAFASRAYRRPANDADIEPLLRLFDHAIERGEPFLAALRLAVKGTLVSPNFLFLVEPEPAKGGVYELGPWPLAARLSYFLWASMPDDELSAAAASGEILKPETLRAQTERMLASERARGLAENFSLQWLGLVSLGETVRPDAKKFPEFDDELADAMKGEAVALFEYILRNNRSLVELVDADYVMLNERLARHYGIPDVVGPEFRPVPLSDHRRGGVVSLAAVLTATSHPLRSSPVVRGKWVLAELLGGKVPPPPPNVPSLPDDDTPRDGISLRERLELHRARAECNGCHSRIDPLGFGLENFDPLGRWRDDIAGQPVDSAGVLPSGEKFNGPAELKRVLLKRNWDIMKNLARKMLGYALGRELTKFDACVVDQSVKALHEGGHRSHILVERIVLSYPFSHRYVKIVAPKPVK